MNIIKLRAMLEQFFMEDIGDGDLSADYLFAAETIGEMKLIAKEDGIFCGRDIIVEGFRLVQPAIQVQCRLQDGDPLHTGQIIAEAKGPIRGLLTAERVILNLVQRMSAISTKTNQLVCRLKDTNTKVCDTRKTIPGLRMLDKYAVRMGGGFNHRNSLNDAVMLKDNHIAYAGSIVEAVRTVRGKLGHTTKIEVEIETLDQLREAVRAEADIIMFDNCLPEDIAQWKEEVPAQIVTEASGMITEETIEQYGNTGVDYISVGALTHSVKSLDISADVVIHQ